MPKNKAPRKKRAAASETATKARRYRGASGDERRLERRAALVAAGLEIIGSSGYQASTVRAVCQQAGLTERYFYESFANREALLCAVYQDQIDGMRSRMLAAVAEAKSVGDPQVREAIAEFFRTLQQPQAARIILFEVLGVSDTVDQLYQDTMHQFAELLLELAQTMGLPLDARMGDRELLSAGLVGALTHIAQRWVLTGYEKPIEAVIDSGLAILTAVVSHCCGTE